MEIKTFFSLMLKHSNDKICCRQSRRTLQFAGRFSQHFGCAGSTGFPEAVLQCHSSSTLLCLCFSLRFSPTPQSGPFVFLQAQWCFSSCLLLSCLTQLSSSCWLHMGTAWQALPKFLGHLCKNSPSTCNASVLDKIPDGLSGSGRSRYVNNWETPWKCTEPKLVLFKAIQRCCPKNKRGHLSSLLCSEQLLMLLQPHDWEFSEMSKSRRKTNFKVIKYTLPSRFEASVELKSVISPVLLITG